MATYTPHTKEDIKEMLRKIRVYSLKGLFSDIPLSLQIRSLKIPSGKSIADTERYITDISKKNKVFDIVLRGAGAYKHYIPPVVKNLSSRSEFLTAYTPYQAELSQGILQSIFEYQTMICELCGLDAANASHYDGSTAAAEALLMCVDNKRKKVMLASNIKPDTLDVIKTYLDNVGVEIVFAPQQEDKFDIDTARDMLDSSFAAIYIEQPSYYGTIVDAQAIGDLAKSKNIKFIMGVNPIAIGLLKKPSECGADIAVGEGQPLGLSLSFGGPYLGFMATTKALQRKLPGRIVGETVDSEGRRAYVLTLQAREQHIRREKASSNICSNQAHCALTAGIYLATMGEKGLAKVAALCVSNAHYLKDCLANSGLTIQNKYEFFNEFVTYSEVSSQRILDALSRKNILGGLPLDEHRILWCATEMVTKKEIDKAARIVKEVVKC